jgi:pyruvate decarboxylase
VSDLPLLLSRCAESFVTDAAPQYASYPTTDIRHILPLLVPSFGKVHSARSEPHGESLESKIKSGRMEPQLVEPKGEEIKHEWFWQRMGRWFADNGELGSLPRIQHCALTPHHHQDIIITETGTSSFGLINVPLPSHSTYVAQILWGAIGWSVGAALGCALAATEQKPRRTVLFVGDGSLQLVSARSILLVSTQMTLHTSLMQHTRRRCRRSGR